MCAENGLKVHTDFERSGDLIRCGACHEIFATTCPDCDGKPAWFVDAQHAEGCTTCEGWGIVLLPHAVEA